MKPLLLIDGDLILHRSCVAVEKDIRWDDDYHVLFSSFEEAWHNVEIAIERLMDRFDTERHLIALSGSGNFRKAIDPTYKGNRSGTRKPLCFARAKEELQSKYRTYSRDMLEADDVMGIFATRNPDAIVCSQDKDLKTVPCTIYDGTRVTKVSETEADHWHLFQTLVGDTSDGYPGCPGIGPKKAQILLEGADDVPQAWGWIVQAFEKAGLTADDALKQARLARILRDSDWDAERKQPILWNPDILDAA